MRLNKYLNENKTNPKYPRTFHVPWSEEVHSDDKVLENMESFLNVPLTITVKMDGSNVGISFDTVSSRSGNIDQHPSFDMLKQKHAIIKYDIPENMIFYGEWLYAVHSIEYENLDDYLMIFAILENNKWLSFKDVKEYSKLLGLNHVPIVKENIKFRTIEEMKKYTTDKARQVISRGHEGIVIRKSSSFRDFSTSTVKYVRRGHVQTDKHWKFKEIKVQKLNK